MRQAIAQGLRDGTGGARHRVISVALAATSLGWAGCSSGPHAVVHQRPAGAVASAGPTGGPATAQHPVSDWVTALVDGNYLRACTDIADTSVTFVLPFTTTQCNQLPERDHGTPPGDPEPPVHPQETEVPNRVQVAGPPVSRGSMVITAEQATIDRQRIDRVIAAYQTPANKTALNTSNQPMGVTKLDGIWYCNSSESIPRR